MMTDKYNESCFMMHVFPGKLEDMRAYWDEANVGRAQHVNDHLKRTGIARLLAFMQGMDRGDYMLMYINSRDSLDKSLSEITGYTEPYTLFTSAKFSEFTGFDFSKSGTAPDLEKLFDWQDSPDKMSGEDRAIQTKPSAFAIPILDGKVDDLRDYWKKSRDKMDETTNHLRDLNVKKLLAFHQKIPDGDFLVMFMESIDNPQTVMYRAATQNTNRSRFVWEGFKNFSGLNLSDDTTKLFNLELLFDWNENQGIQTVETNIAYTQ